MVYGGEKTKYIVSMKIAIIGCGPPGKVALNKLELMGHEVVCLNNIDESVKSNCDIAINNDELNDLTKVVESFDRLNYNINRLKLASKDFETCAPMQHDPQPWKQKHNKKRPYHG